jgi:LemA protein
LKSNQNFLALQSQLEGTENRIAVARRDYNAAVQDYNTSLRTFPTVIWAKTIHSGSKPMQLFQATAAAQSAPTVDFGAPNPGAPLPPAAAAPGSAPPEPAPATK